MSTHFMVILLIFTSIAFKTGLDVGCSVYHSVALASTKNDAFCVIFYLFVLWTNFHGSCNTIIKRHFNLCSHSRTRPSNTYFLTFRIQWPVSDHRITKSLFHVLIHKADFFSSTWYPCVLIFVLQCVLSVSEKIVGKLILAKKMTCTVCFVSL